MRHSGNNHIIIIINTRARPSVYTKLIKRSLHVQKTTTNQTGSCAYSRKRAHLPRGIRDCTAAVRALFNYRLFDYIFFHIYIIRCLYSCERFTIGRRKKARFLDRAVKL